MNEMLSVSHEKIGNVLVAAGKREDALKKQVSPSQSASPKATRVMPNGNEIVSHEKIGNVLVAAGKREDALKH